MKVIYEGKEVELPEGADGFAAAKALDPEQKNKDVGLKIGDVIYDMRSPLHEGDVVSFVRVGSPEAFEMLNHSTSHLMAQALMHLYPGCLFGFGPAKIYRLARHALGERYPDDVLLHWLKNFYRRFFVQQFKRSCLPDGPKIGSITLSPRGDWRMPSDACAAVWQAELDQLG